MTMAAGIPEPVTIGRATNGRPPECAGPFTVQFRCGHIDRKHTYTIDQLRWTDTGDAWDVVAVMGAGEVEQSGAPRTASGNYA